MGNNKRGQGVGRFIALLALVTSVSACASSRPRQQAHPAYGHPQQSASPYGAPQHAPPQQRPPRQPQLANALTPFGILLQQLPALPQQLPPLPGVNDWLRQYWPQPAPPQPGPSPNQPAEAWPAAWVNYEDAVLQETNAYRAAGAVCGGQSFGPAAPVSAHPQLRNAARGHSRDMAERNYFDHRSPEGVGPMQRAQAAGFPGGFVGENIAAGYPDPREVVRGWMDSPGHCLNIMEPRYRYLGVGYFQAQGGEFGSYWTQNFGG